MNRFTFTSASLEKAKPFPVMETSFLQAISVAIMLTFVLCLTTPAAALYAQDKAAPAIKADPLYAGMTLSHAQPNKQMDTTSDKAMMKDLYGRTGEDFDKAFLEMMIIHHRQALEMAKRAKSVAKHPEIKKLADQIIAEQSMEVDKMRQWHRQWGYAK